MIERRRQLRRCRRARVKHSVRTHSSPLSRSVLRRTGGRCTHAHMCMHMYTHAHMCMCTPSDSSGSRRFPNDSALLIHTEEFFLRSESSWDPAKTSDRQGHRCGILGMRPVSNDFKLDDDVPIVRATVVSADGQVLSHFEDGPEDGSNPTPRGSRRSLWPGFSGPQRTVRYDYS